ncbi:MAG: hypothetical protein KC503_37655 [Myxococcales bacterium]|nr:hypothetical protein [Myxococcales bacterium]
MRYALAALLLVLPTSSAAKTYALTQDDVRTLSEYLKWYADGHSGNQPSAQLINMVDLDTTKIVLLHVDDTGVRRLSYRTVNPLTLQAWGALTSNDRAALTEAVKQHSCVFFGGQLRPHTEAVDAGETNALAPAANAARRIVAGCSSRPVGPFTSLMIGRQFVEVAAKVHQSAFLKARVDAYGKLVAKRYARHTDQLRKVRVVKSGQAVRAVRRRQAVLRRAFKPVAVKGVRGLVFKVPDTSSYKRYLILRKKGNVLTKFRR